MASKISPEKALLVVRDVLRRRGPATYDICKRLLARTSFIWASSSECPFVVLLVAAILPMICTEVSGYGGAGRV
jgi:hypothetical protein